MNNKVKLFSHTDLDGHGCNIVAKYTIGKIVNLECENLNYDNVNERIKGFFNSKELEEYNIVYITDISVNNEVAELIESKINQIGIKVRLLDHHPTALELNKYSWCTVDIERDGEKTSGTRMLYDELLWCIDRLSKKGMINKEILFDFVENVRKYDTWLWKEKYDDIIPKKLNDIFFILGYERFENEIINYLNCNLYSTNNFICENKLLLELQQEKIDKYIEKKNKEIIECDIAGNKAGVVFAEQFQSELGNRLSELNPKYDLIVMISDKTISYRTVKDNINCGEIAKLFGGGGHPKASGSQISDKVKLEYIKSLFKL
ncbi:DHHA1 domain-containing protein [Clostridium sp. VAP52]|uniref:DHH family phosphoesterase n=1 Tax=Clostridium sp. VAP52 TaxID=2949977 RepID=UPI002079905F|nr:DHHA1 domain-containing protein [Clostridium sp. VAP52]